MWLSGVCTLGTPLRGSLTVHCVLHCYNATLSHSLCIFYLQEAMDIMGMTEEEKAGRKFLLGPVQTAK